MSDKKTYTASEVARMILEKTHQTLRKHEELLKSKNSAHEIDLGEEPNNDEAECPESLKASGSSSSGEKSEKKPKAEASESSEDPAMEDEPLSDFENEAEEEYEEEAEEEAEEEQEPKKFFKKSESGMFTVQYMRLAKDDSEGGEETVDFGGMEKARVDEGKSAKENPEYHKRATDLGKKPKKVWTNPTKREIDYSRSGMKNSRPSSAADQKQYEAEAKERSKKIKEQLSAEKAKKN